MGLLISRFRRKKTTTEVLEKLEVAIKGIENDGISTERKHRRIIAHVMAYSIGLYVLFALLYYFKYVGKGQNWFSSILHASPLLVLPIIVIFLRSAISWYYNWTLNKNQLKLRKMREEKKKILEDVMNTETYKVAKKILDKFGQDEQRALKPFTPTLNVPGNASSTPLSATPGQIRQRQLAIEASPIKPNNLSVVTLTNGPRLKSELLPRPIFDSNRSALEKVVDFILKDGPSNRMALICSQCHSHNGMVIQEEFEFMSYRCAYCGSFNAARKQRPLPPPLNLTPKSIRSGHSDDSSIASSGSESDHDDEKILALPDKTDVLSTSSAEVTQKTEEEKKKD